MKRILGIILGVLMCIGGFYCLMDPSIPFSSISVIFAIVLIENAIGRFIIWIKIKQLGGSRAILLINAILSLVCGISLLTNVFTKLFLDTFLLTAISVYMLVEGVFGIIASFKLIKVSGGNFVLTLIFGILLVLCGIFSLVNPAILALSIGINMAINIIVTGASLIVLSIVL